MTTITRRFFCQAALRAGAAAAVSAAAWAPDTRGASTSSAPTGKRNPLWKTAVGLNGFESGERKYKQRYPIWEILHFAQEQGFDGVELVANWPQGNYPAANESDRIRALKRLYEGYGLRVFSIQLGADGAFAPEPEARRKWLDEVADRMQLAAQLGCAHVGFWPGGGLRGQTIDQALDRLVSSFREVQEIARRAGVIPGFEIEPPFVFNTAEHLARIQRDSGMKFIFDPSHFDLMNGSTGRPHELLLRLGVSNLAYVHLTDTDGTLRDGGTSKHLAVGEGHAQISESLRILRANGFRGWIMVDEWEVPDPYDACRKAKQALDGAAA